MYDLSRDKYQNKKPFVILTELTSEGHFSILGVCLVVSFSIMVDFYASQTKKFVRFTEEIHPFMTYLASVSHRYS